MFELMILLVVVVLSWWLISTAAVGVARGYRKIQRRRADARGEDRTGRQDAP